MFRAIIIDHSVKTRFFWLLKTTINSSRFYLQLKKVGFFYLYEVLKTRK